MNQCLVLQNVEPVAKELGVASNSIRNWFVDKVLPSLPEALAKEHPGPKPKVTPTPTHPALSVSKGKRAALSMEVEECPDHCPQDCFACPHCQSQRVWKNGRYRVINWLAFLSVRWFSQKRVAIQRLRCGTCGRAIDTRQRQSLAQARRHLRLAILQTVGGVQQIQVGFVQPPRHHRKRNHISMSLSANRPSITPILKEESFEPDDIHLLCSDGLWGVVPDSILWAAANEFDPQDAAEKLVMLANQSGGPDNISVIVARRKDRRVMKTMEDDTTNG